jgi:hypothetical protein
VEKLPLPMASLSSNVTLQKSRIFTWTITLSAPPLTRSAKKKSDKTYDMTIAFQPQVTASRSKL